MKFLAQEVDLVPLVWVCLVKRHTKWNHIKLILRLDKTIVNKEYNVAFGAVTVKYWLVFGDVLDGLHDEALFCIIILPLCHPVVFAVVVYHISIRY